MQADNPERAAEAGGLRWLLDKLALYGRFVDTPREKRAFQFAAAFARAAHEGETDDERTALAIKYTGEI